MKVRQIVYWIWDFLVLGYPIFCCGKPSVYTKEFHACHIGVVADLMWQHKVHSKSWSKYLLISSGFTIVYALYENLLAFGFSLYGSNSLFV